MKIGYTTGFSLVLQVILPFLFLTSNNLQLHYEHNTIISYNWAKHEL
jgi:hypothetical protein